MRRRRRRRRREISHLSECVSVKGVPPIKLPLWVHTGIKVILHSLLFLLKHTGISCRNRNKVQLARIVGWQLMGWKLHWHCRRLDAAGTKNGAKTARRVRSHCLVPAQTCPRHSLCAFPRCPTLPSPVRIIKCLKN